jgi:hypothetical protein
LVKTLMASPMLLHFAYMSIKLRRNDTRTWHCKGQQRSWQVYILLLRVTCYIPPNMNNYIHLKITFQDHLSAPHW